MHKNYQKKIALLGGGPSALFVYKNLVEKESADFTIDIFEAKDSLGAGMPYSFCGSGYEHVTNVSANEIPELFSSVADWIKAVPENELNKYGIDANYFNDYKVLPRLLFGHYLAAQFTMLIEEAGRKGIQTDIHLNSKVTDLVHPKADDKITVEINYERQLVFDDVVICIGHFWPLTYENQVPGYFDSPYPPKKIAMAVNEPIAIRGSSLTAIDAIRTLARSNGRFIQQAPHSLLYQVNEGSEHFKMVMHSRSGLLPAIRFHLQDPHLSKKHLLTEKELKEHRNANNGFIDLDYIFEKDFIDSFKKTDPVFYEAIRNMSIETFVDAMMGMREDTDPFVYFKAEYEEAAQSIRERESIYWKEKLAILSFALNYPAKYFSAEDMIRLQKILMPLISIVIAFVPQSSCEELIALHESGRLSLVAVDDESRIEPGEGGGVDYFYTDEVGNQCRPHYNMFVDCTGQPHLPFESFPFRSLLKEGRVAPAMLPFRNKQRAMEMMASEPDSVQVLQDQYYLKVPGLAINDQFQVIDKYNNANQQIYLMAVSYMGGFNPDYSGLDFCEEASGKIVKSIFEKLQKNIVTA